MFRIMFSTNKVAKMKYCQTYTFETVLNEKVVFAERKFSARDDEHAKNLARRWTQRSNLSKNVKRFGKKNWKTLEVFSVKS